jgi:hypothetical protein
VIVKTVKAKVNEAAAMMEAIKAKYVVVLDFGAF